MASDSEAEARRPNGVAVVNDHIDSPLEPSTPQDVAALPDSSQVTLPSTEIPPSPSPLDPTQSFKTEVNDDRGPLAATVIPSSLTPPPSTQVEMHNGNARRAYSQSQQSNYFSPPATVLINARGRGLGADDVAASDYVPPSSHQIADASADELRALLQTCVTETQKLKMETAHHKLQYSLLSLQADEEAKRADVEHEMLRREIDALRMAEHSRQAKRELSTFSEALQIKYLETKTLYEEAVDENEALGRRLKSAKKIIQQKDEEVMSLLDERDQLLNRIRENREHFHMLCSPGGLFHGVLTPKQATSPADARATNRNTARAGDRDTESGHRLSTLLEVISQDNNSAPSTPIMPSRSGPRHLGKHHRNAQSMSSLPTTPIHRPRGEHAALLPSVNLVPQTEPSQRHSYRQYEPATPTPKANRRRSSRESTISADDNEELARQAMKSVEAARSFTSRTSLDGSQRRERNPELDRYDSQASQAARELLLREPRNRSFTSRSAGSREDSPQPGDRSSKLQAQLFSNLRGGPDKRKFSGNHEPEPGSLRSEQGSPPKRSRASSGDGRFGLGIQYGQ
jgi:acetyl-CoA acyltransferase 1